MKKILITLFIISMLAISVGFVFAAGFDEFGYNYQAKNFVGTGSSWCQGKLGWDKSVCDAYMGAYANDHLKMKWNSEWDRGKAEGWSNPPYDAWSDNQWNGMFPGGSGETWHYMNRWIGPCVDGTPTTNGGYCIWGHFEVTMSHGTYEGQHFWDAHAIPAGVGS